MTFEAILLGIVQGITEFLPVSSSAHLILIPWIFGWHGTMIDSLNFDVALHAGTFIAIISYFWRDWLNLLHKFFSGTGDGTWKTGEGRIVWFIIIATIPAGLIGLGFEHTIEEVFRNPLLVSAALICISGVMWAADRFVKGSETLGKITLGQAVLIGCAQALALIPGVSRSGITISAGLFVSLKREDAARFSFLLSTPIIAAAAVYNLRKLHLAQGEAIPFAAGVIVSAVVGYLSIRFLLKYLSRHSLMLFVWYRVIFAVAAVIIIAVR